MRAVRANGSEVALVEVPAPAGDGVRVKVGYAGICGSDLALLDGGECDDVILGHELAGWTPDGIPVAIEPQVPCEVCPPCLAGAYNVCVEGDDTCLGLASLDGGMADEVLVPERCLVPLPERISLADACLVEPIAVGLHGLRRARVQAGERVAVIGGGSIGLLAGAVARALGAEAAIATRHPHQRQMADRLGLAVPDGDYDAVVVAAAGRDAVDQAAGLARAGGRIVFLALIEGSLLEGDAAMRELTAITSMGYAGNGRREIEQAADLLADQPELGELITHRFPLDRAVEAFQVARDRSAGAIKVVLEV
jgi:threonine dehydrogenase-like Zn-dependent dehydrogenase